MSKKAAALRLVGAAIAVGTLAIIYREDIGPYTKGLMSLVSSTSASEAEAQPAQMPVPQVPVAESSFAKLRLLRNSLAISKR